MAVGAAAASRATASARRATTALAALEQVDLTDAANKRIGAYSKGMRQRVKLAQAIAHEPELLVLDEPLSGMDPLARRKTIKLLRNWAAAGRTSSCRATSFTRSRR